MTALNYITVVLYSINHLDKLFTYEFIAVMMITCILRLSPPVVHQPWSFTPPLALCTATLEIYIFTRFASKGKFSFICFL